MPILNWHTGCPHKTETQREFTMNLKGFSDRLANLLVKDGQKNWLVIFGS
jgi:hypothetical protein